jgi:hypothetical protein
LNILLLLVAVVEVVAAHRIPLLRLAVTAVAVAAELEEHLLVMLR